MMERLAAGDRAPDFTLTDATGATVSLSDYAGRRVVVYFYPAALTPGCTTQAVDFTAELERFREAGLDVVGISPDEPTKLARFVTKEHLTVRLLADPTRETLKAYRAFGMKKLYGREVEGVIRSTFVVNVDASGQGTIEVAQYNVRATGHVAKLLKDLEIG